MWYWVAKLPKEGTGKITVRGNKLWRQLKNENKLVFPCLFVGVSQTLCSLSGCWSNWKLSITGVSGPISEEMGYSCFNCSIVVNYVLLGKTSGLLLGAGAWCVIPSCPSKGSWKPGVRGRKDVWKPLEERKRSYLWCGCEGSAGLCVWAQGSQSAVGETWGAPMLLGSQPAQALAGAATALCFDTCRFQTSGWKH